MVYNDFKSSIKNRQRYWTRNMIGFIEFQKKKPNKGHDLLVKYEKEGIIDFLVTQNVDLLHQKAGHKNVINLHGNNYETICLDCKNISSRVDYQKRLIESNLDIYNYLTSENFNTKKFFSDGDAQILNNEIFNSFVIPNCIKCDHGMIKPNLVFFGENVDLDIVNSIKKNISLCKGVLVIGTTLETYSSFKFIKYANENRIPISILNIGETKGDHLANLKIEGNISMVLDEVMKFYQF
jgi:NAD+-dependent protein deacetylase sirtuin 4